VSEALPIARVRAVVRLLRFDVFPLVFAKRSHEFVPTADVSTCAASKLGARVVDILSRFKVAAPIATSWTC
jgi:hypothetical protein